MEICLESDKENFIKNSEEASEEGDRENTEEGRAEGDQEAEPDDATHRTH
jgi:hypothetical protein